MTSSPEAQALVVLVGKFVTTLKGQRERCYVVVTSRAGRCSRRHWHGSERIKVIFPGRGSAGQGRECLGKEAQS